MCFSIEPIVTVPWPDCSIVQMPSQRRSCGQMRPQISGMLLVAEETRQASSILSSAASFSQSGILFCKGQPCWQKGTPHCEQRPA